MNTTFQTMNTMFRMMDYQAGNIGAWGKGTLARTRLIVHMIFIVVLATLSLIHIWAVGPVRRQLGGKRSFFAKL